MPVKTGPALVTATSCLKALIMPFALYMMSAERPFAAAGFILAISLIAILERQMEDAAMRAVSAIANRIALLPLLSWLAISETAVSPQFPMLMVLGSAFITLKELFFVYRSLRHLIWDEEGVMPRRTQKVNAVALVAVILLYTFKWAPYHHLAMIAVLTIGTADIGDFLFSAYRKKSNLKDINLATRITLSRLLMSPVFLIVYFYDRNLDFADNSLTLQIFAVLLSVFLVATDGLDGYFARKRNEVTKLGKYLDPFSDKICTMTVFLCFMASGYSPVWMVAFIFYRETAVDTIRTLAAAENVVMDARRSGKWKTGLQGTAIITILTLATVLSGLGHSAFPSLYPEMFANFLLVWNYLPWSLMGLVTLVTVLSGFDYVLASRNILDKYFR